MKTDTIICGDALDVLKDMPDNRIDMILTSPPYNFGRDYDVADDSRDISTYMYRLFLIFDQCIRILKSGGRLVINIQPLFSEYVPTHHMISGYLRQRGMIWKGEIIWEKNNYNCAYTTWGSWKSPSSPYLKYTWEFIEVFCKDSIRKSGDSAMADITADEFKEWTTAKWSIAPERNMRRYDHPAMFPEELARRALLLFSFRNDLIIDPFNGTGTTCVTAKKLGRKYIGIDISEKYCRTAEERLHLTNRPHLMDMMTVHRDG